jgi:hypothetical protein
MAAKTKTRHATKSYVRTRPNIKVRRRRSKLLSIEASMEITGLGASLTRTLREGRHNPVSSVWRSAVDHARQANGLAQRRTSRIG